MSSRKLLSGRSHIWALLAVLISAAAAAWLLFNRQAVIDQISFWQYHPPAAVAALADRSRMNDSGKFYFYTSRPALEDSQAFNKQCGSKEQGTAILGCYTGRFIYIYNVTDPKLDGIREVTAAHEMLHAAYERLSSGEQAKVDSLLEAEYSKLKNDKALADRMAFYDRTEPGQRDNELHSVIGTEINQISPPLEAYYKKYFADRSQVVALHTKYEALFRSLQERGAALSAQLTELAGSIETESAAYNKEVTKLNVDINTFNAKARAGEFASATEFQASRSELMARANQLEADRAAINAKVATYEKLRQELLSIASQSEALNRSIDSSLAPAPSL